VRHLDAKIWLGKKFLSQDPLAHLSIAWQCNRYPLLVLPISHRDKLALWTYRIHQDIRLLLQQLPHQLRSMELTTLFVFYVGNLDILPANVLKPAVSNVESLTSLQWTMESVILTLPFTVVLRKNEILSQSIADKKHSSSIQISSTSIPTQTPPFPPRLSKWSVISRQIQNYRWIINSHLWWYYWQWCPSYYHTNRYISYTIFWPNTPIWYKNQVLQARQASQRGQRRRFTFRFASEN
jgi:hypothetical protein